MPCTGEISRAHRGVLFPDGLPELSQHMLKVMRQPMDVDFQ